MPFCLLPQNGPEAASPAPPASAFAGALNGVWHAGNAAQDAAASRISWKNLAGMLTW